MAIKDWHEDDRPREKLLKFGAENLTDSEILAIFLRTGTKKMSAIELARSLIDEFGSLAELLSAPKSKVLSCHGVGEAKYVQVIVSLEMGKRYLDSKLKTGRLLSNTQIVKDYIATQLRRESLVSQKEVFAILCMDDSLNLLDYQILFVGGVSSCSVCVKVVLRHAINHLASNIIIAHNHIHHLSVNPSDEDNKLTLVLYNASQLIDISLIDHIIVSKNDVFSYAEKQQAPFN